MFRGGLYVKERERRREGQRESFCLVRRKSPVYILVIIIIIPAAALCKTISVKGTLL